MASVIDKKSVESGLVVLKNTSQVDTPVSQLVANSLHMQEVLNLAEQVSGNDCTVIIMGESGVGKDVIAQFIHEKGPRSKAPFVRVNCGAIPETLLESELFGYERGAFTGAHPEGKMGKFEQAKNGTIFLDEIGDLPLALQVKLLHVLQEHEIVRIGGTVTRKVNARILAATNRNLKEMIAEGKFRQDLYFRLNVIPIHIPPLRSRKDDIIPLIKFFKRKYEAKYNIFYQCSSELLRIFTDYDWPGNVRELENTIERIYVMLGSNIPITPAGVLKYGFGLDVAINPQAPAVTVHRIGNLKEILAEAEDQLLVMAARKYRGIKEIGQALGIDPSTVSRKLKRIRQNTPFIKTHSGDMLDQ